MIIDFETVKKFEKLKSNNIINSKIYINNNKLYKIYNQDSESKINFLNTLSKKEKYIDEIMNYSINDCVLPKGKIYYKDKFIGIFMNYYKEYSSLYKLINNDMNVDKKILLLTKFINALKNMHDNNLIHGDIHLGNILTDFKDIKIIDLDESYFNYENSDSDIKSDILNSLNVIISVIYNFDLEEIIPFNNNDKKKFIIQFLNSISIDYEFKDYVKNIYLSKDMDIVYPTKFLRTLNAETINYDNQKLSKTLKLIKWLKKQVVRIIINST